MIQKSNQVFKKKQFCAVQVPYVLLVFLVPCVKYKVTQYKFHNMFADSSFYKTENNTGMQISTI